MSNEPAHGPLSGRRIALPETRELDRLVRMLDAEGAETLRCPMVAIKDTPDPLPVQEWLGHFSFDDLILYTGEGVRRLHGFARRLDLQTGFLDGLHSARKITRAQTGAGIARARVEIRSARREADDRGSDRNIAAAGPARPKGGGSALPGRSRGPVHRLFCGMRGQNPTQPCPRVRRRDYPRTQLFHEAFGYRHCGSIVAVGDDSANECCCGGGEVHD